ncbi:DUF6542 domain-containing protein [Mycobacterium ostraviense]|uniref:DUF6542 domain-containing protein n=1 Tax=Mycobacterium ostraviense TaxID=2738409 RepID=UPI0015D4AA2F|nr:DUF6542 domain-containing protein [Mycobacterium ostraviense]UGT92477.1 hypothetical protein LTS72_03425 [Mycobacterium ostraviense]
MSAQRASSAVEPSRRSIVPNIPGVPWWAAVLIAVTATAVGYAFDAGHKELTHVFAGFYVAGCVAAVLAVRQSGLFTAVIQPPLILFFTVPGAYWLFHGGKIDKFKDLLINCGYPLIERFPLMLGTAGGVLLIGLIRWSFGMTQRTTTAGKADDATTTTTRRKSAISGLAAKLSGWLSPGDATEEAPDPGSQPAQAIGRTSRSGRTARSGRSTARRTDRTRSRHARSAAADDQPDPAAERPRRRRPAPARDYDAADPPPRSRRRPRPQDDPDLRAQPPRETRRDPHTRRNPYERPAPRSSRFDPYGAYEPYEPPRRRSAPGGPTGANPTHHPISQVRYRGSVPYDEPRDAPPPDRRNRSRTPRRPQPDSREYDV